MKILFTIAVWMCGSICIAFAQELSRLKIQIVDQDGNQAVPSATIRGEAREVVGFTDRSGVIMLHLASGRYHWEVSCMGYKTSTFHITLSKDTSIQLALSKISLKLDEVKVTAREHVLGSVSTIDRQAINHIQAYSLKDVLQLVPGQLATNPDLLSPQQFVLRQIVGVGEDTEAFRAGALGTQLMLDGVPLSNNANMQFDTFVSFPNTAGRGFDLRAVSADNIESIDVVRGVPSVRYGDFTSGIVKIITRLDTAIEGRVRINPDIFELSATIGRRLGKEDVVNLNIGYLSASADKRNPISDYNRLQASFAWERRSNHLVQTHRIIGYTTIDERRSDPNSSWYASPRESSDRQIRWSSQFRWRGLGSAQNGQIELLSSATYQHQHSKEEYYVSRDAMLLSAAMSDTVAVGFYGETNYLASTQVDGKPLNLYTMLHTEWSFSGLLAHRLAAGIEHRMDGNFGDGRKVDPYRPPNLSSNRGVRPEVFTNLDPMQQVSLYLEDQVRYRLLGLPMITQLGFRYDQLIVGGHTSGIPSPRLNHQVTLTDGLNINIGAGIAAKMPTLSVFYPGKRYIDLISLNHYANNPAERLGMVTTRVFDLDNKGLRPYKSEKLEAGLQWQSGKGSYNLTAYHERTDDAFGTLTELQTIMYPIYGVKDRPVGQLPVLYPDPVSERIFFAGIDRPENNRVIINKGVEYTFEFPRIPSIRTQFILNGLYGVTRSYDKSIEVSPLHLQRQDENTEFLPFYRTTSDRKNVRFNSSLRAVHHLPQLGFVFHVLWQAVWKDSNYYLNVPVAPVGLITRNGQYIELSDEEANAENMKEYHRYTNILPSKWPPLHLINVRVSKEWPGIGEFSFFVNNLFNNRPLHRNGRTNVLVRRNEPLFFGGEIQLNLVDIIRKIK